VTPSLLSHKLIKIEESNPDTSRIRPKMKFNTRPLLLFLVFSVAGSDAKGLRGDNGNHATAGTSVQESEDNYDNHLQRYKTYDSSFLKRYEEDEKDKNVIYFTDLRHSTAES
jgi:hypothetical protein